MDRVIGTWPLDKLDDAPKMKYLSYLTEGMPSTSAELILQRTLGRASTGNKSTGLTFDVSTIFPELEPGPLICKNCIIGSDYLAGVYDDNSCIVVLIDEEKKYAIIPLPLSISYDRLSKQRTGDASIEKLLAPDVDVVRKANASLGPLSLDNMLSEGAFRHPLAPILHAGYLDLPDFEEDFACELIALHAKGHVDLSTATKLKIYGCVPDRKGILGPPSAVLGGGKGKDLADPHGHLAEAFSFYVAHHPELEDRVLLQGFGTYDLQQPSEKTPFHQPELIAVFDIDLSSQLWDLTPHAQIEAIQQSRSIRARLLQIDTAA